MKGEIYYGKKFNLMAINLDEAKAMEDAIQTYIDDCNHQIQAIADYTISASDGFYGAVQAKKVDEYIANTCKEIQKIVTYFYDFKEALIQVEVDYATKDGRTTTSDVNPAAEKKEDMITVNKFAD